MTNSTPPLGLSCNGFDRAARAWDLLEEMDLENTVERYPHQLSAGERQRVAIARALANNQDIQLADELAGNLDSVHSGRILEILIGIQQKRAMTLTVVTHENEIAHEAARQVRIRNGKVEA
jgi:predicted ABC-type transport system involved in lysophospholipase L1 biosynthesis ATPase subunit